MIAAYMLHALAASQSMGKLLHAFKNVRKMHKFLHENAAAPTDGIQPLLTRETMSYAISLSVSCVTYHANNDTSKSRASGAYEQAITDLNNMSDPDWHTLLRQLLIEYITLLTNPEGTSPSAPSLKRQDFLERDKASKEARAATATAAGGDGGGGEGGGDGDGGDGDEDGDGSGPGEEEAATAKPAAGKAKGRGKKK